MNNNNFDNMEREFGWDDTITKDDAFILLEPGEYPFTVKLLERARFNGSEKMPACPMAEVSIAINTPEGEVVIKNKLLLHSKTEWVLSSFFGSLGLKKKGEPLRMNWNLVTGARGRCEIGNRTHDGKEYNEVKKWIYSEDQQAPAAGGWNPGKF